MTDAVEAVREALRATAYFGHWNENDWFAAGFEAGRTDERAKAQNESALRAAAQDVYRAYTVQGFSGRSAAYAEVPLAVLRSLFVALDGTPYEPSEAEVERAAIGVWRAFHTQHTTEPPEKWDPPFTWDHVHPEVKERKYRSVARAALKAVFS